MQEYGLVHYVVFPRASYLTLSSMIIDNKVIHKSGGQSAQHPPCLENFDRKIEHKRKRFKTRWLYSQGTEFNPPGRKLKASRFHECL